MLVGSGCDSAAEVVGDERLFKLFIGLVKTSGGIRVRISKEAGTAISIRNLPYVYKQ